MDNQQPTTAEKSVSKTKDEIIKEAKKEVKELLEGFDDLEKLV